MQGDVVGFFPTSGRETIAGHWGKLYMKITTIAWGLVRGFLWLRERVLRVDFMRFATNVA